MRGIDPEKAYEARAIADAKMAQLNKAFVEANLAVVEAEKAVDGVTHFGSRSPSTENTN